MYVIDNEVNLKSQFIKTRVLSEVICSYLETEDFVVQPIDFVSPPKWHLAHTTWFFEQFVLKEELKTYQIFDEQFAFLFNSYYETVGDHWLRTNRGNLSRPSVAKIMEYSRICYKNNGRIIRKHSL